MSKGGSTSSIVEVPEYIEKAAQRNLNQADLISKLGFIPEYGPTVAAFTPSQEAAFQGTAQAAGAFGLPGGDMSMRDISGGMPEPTTYAGGVRGYSSLPIYEQALEAFGEARPGQKRYVDSFFIDPVTGVPGSNMQAPVDYTLAPTPGDLGGISAGGGGGATAAGGGGGGGGDTFLGGDYLGGSEASETSLINSDLTDEQFFDIFESGDGVPVVSLGSEGTTDSWVTDQDLYGAPGGFYGSSAANEAALIGSNLSDEDFWNTFEAGSPVAPDVTSGPIAGLVSGGGADGVGNFGQVGDFFGGIGDALGITDYSGQGGGLLSGSNITTPVTPSPAPAPTTFVNDYSDPATLAKYEADRAPGGIFYESSGSQRAEAAQQAAVKSKDDALAQSVDTSELAKLANRKDTAQQWLKDNGYGSYDKDDASDVLRSKVADIEKSQLKQGLKDGVVMENDRYSVYVNGTLISSEKRSSEAKAKLASATG
jgi:hypothetical protein